MFKERTSERAKQKYMRLSLHSKGGVIFHSFVFIRENSWEYLVWFLIHHREHH